MHYRMPELGHSWRTDLRRCGQTLLAHGSPAFLKATFHACSPATNSSCSSSPNPSAGSDLAGITHPADARGRSLADHRVEDLDQRRPLCRLRDVPGPHQLGRPQAPRPHLVCGADYERPGVDVATDPRDHRDARVLPGVPRRGRQSPTTTSSARSTTAGRSPKRICRRRTFDRTRRSGQPSRAQPGALDPALLALVRGADRSQRSHRPSDGRTYPHRRLGARSAFGRRVTDLLLSARAAATGIAAYWKLAAGIYKPLPCPAAQDSDGQADAIAWAETSSVGASAAMAYLNSRICRSSRADRTKCNATRSASKYSACRANRFAERGKTFRGRRAAAKNWSTTP